MKKNTFVFLIGLFIFIIFIPIVDYNISYQKYVSKLGMFNISSNYEKTKKIDDKYIEIYEIAFKSKINYEKFVENLSKAESVVKYDSTSIEKNKNLKRLFIELEEKKFIKNEADKVYVIYKTIDHKIHSDIIFTTLASDSCYFLIDFKINV